MAAQGPLTASAVIKKAVLLPLNIIRYAATEPALTGALLYALTRGSPELKEKLLAPFQSNIFSKDGAARLKTFVQVLKALFAWGIVTRANSALNKLALNGWSLRKPGTPWRWDGRTELVVVTGGCSGFGYEMVKGFAGKARVIVMDISDLPPALSKLPEVHYYKCDVSDYSQIHSVADAIRSEHGNPSVLINNAGIGTGVTVLDSKPEVLDKIFKINLVSHFVLIKEFLPAMLDAKKGHIVGIASMASFMAAPGLLDYCCTKVGVLYLNDGLRAELHQRYPNGRTIQTSVVHPSWHQTAILKGQEHRLNKVGIYPDPPSNVSDAVVEQVLAGRSGQIFVPKSQSRISGMRNWPIWWQDALAYVAKTKGFSLTPDDEETLPP